MTNQKAILFSKDRDMKLSGFYKKILEFKIFSSEYILFLFNLIISPIEFPKIPSEFKDITEYIYKYI